MQSSMKKQAGAAAIYFVFIAVAILAVGALGVEGSRYITEKAHLGDVMEATAVAVSESDDIRDDNRFDRQRAEKTARAWVSYLVPDSHQQDFRVSRAKKELDKDINGEVIKRTVHEYRIDSTTSHDSWMYMAGIPSFEPRQQIYNKAAAARVRTDFEPVDVAFVADFSASMDQYQRIGNLKSAVKSVTQTIFDATEELKRKHPGEPIENSSFAFVPFSKRIIAKKGRHYYCASMLLPPKGSKYDKPMGEPSFSELAKLGYTERRRWMEKQHYSRNEKEVMNDYISYAKSTRGSWYLPLDCNRGYYKVTGPGWETTMQCNVYYSSHIDYARTASEIQLTRDYRLSTPMRIGQSNLDINKYCSGSKYSPRFYNIPRQEFDSQRQVDSFNKEIRAMTVGGGTDMYHGLLAAPGQFEGAKNKNRFVFVLSDGDENTVSFSKLVNKGLCRNIRQKLATNANGEQTRFEMFVIGLKFRPNSSAYKQCFGKHIYEVRDLSKLKDVILELLTTTTSYNIER